MVTRLEVTNLLLEIDKIDPDAFAVQHPVKDTKGGMKRSRGVGEIEAVLRNFGQITQLMNFHRDGDLRNKF